MQIDWWTLALQAVNFLVLVWLLWRFLYRPVKEVIEKRRQLAEQAFAEAAAKAEEAEAARRDFEAGRAGLAQERKDMLKKLHEELEAERRQVLEDARKKAEELLDAARKSLDEERKAAFTQVRDQISELARELAGDLLRQVGPTAPGEAFLEGLEKQLQEAPEEERARLRKDLAGDGARLTVVTAAPLTPGERGRWDERLSACLALEDKIDFATDPEIMGGVELRFPHALIKFTWADHLRKAGELLQGNDATS